jgi:hypothetical protein
MGLIQSRQAICHHRFHQDEGEDQIRLEVLETSEHQFNIQKVLALNLF